MVLLDELEKAHHDIWSVLLQVMEEGVLTDAQGRRTDFRNTVLVMTSNLGARHFSPGGRVGFSPVEVGQDRAALEHEVLRDAKKTFPPEFLNRLDSTLVFHPLSSDTLQSITRQLLAETGSRIEALGLSFYTEEAAVELLARQGGGSDYGARPLRRAIARLVEDPVADLLLSGQAKPGAQLCVRAKGKEILVQIV